MSPRAISIALGLGVLVLVVVYVAFNHRALFAEAQPAVEVAGEWSMEKDVYWRQRIERDGGVVAYQAFATWLSAALPTAQHPQAHAFGRVLYEEEGLSGTPVCDMRFSMGCYHEFFARAISQYGLGVLPQLGAICNTLPDLANPTNCRHGIGHGIQAWFGYSVQDLIKGLEACKTLPGIEDDASGGCVSGLYMEYNLRTMLDTEEKRQVVDENYLAPCDELSAEDLPACVFWLPQWWTSLFRSIDAAPTDFSAAYARMGSLCREFSPAQHLVDACFQGIGNIISSAAETTHSVEAPVSACDNAASTIREQLMCRSYLALTYKSQNRSYAKEACRNLDSQSLSVCMRFATGKANYAELMPNP